MSAFLSSLDVRFLDDCGPRPMMMVLADFRYSSDLVGAVIVPRGTKFDGATIPQLAMSATGWPGVRAACLHDYLVDSIDRYTADKVFREALGVCGVSEELADAMYGAVRLFSMSIERPDYPQVGA